MLRLLQKARLILLVVVAIFHALLVQFSEPYDEARYAIDISMDKLSFKNKGRPQLRLRYSNYDHYETNGWIIFPA